MGAYQAITEEDDGARFGRPCLGDLGCGVGALLRDVAQPVALARIADGVVLDGNAALAAHGGASRITITWRGGEPLVPGWTTHRVTAGTEQCLLAVRHADRAAAAPAVPPAGLVDRPELMRRVDLALARTPLPDEAFAVAFVDLDGFKRVNDDLGHAAGDRVIAACAACLVQTVRPGDAVARFGGDEFVVLAEAIAGDAGALALAERLRSALAAALHDASGGIATSASVGVAVGHKADESADAIVRDADAAMYAAKSSGRDRAVLFDSALRARVRADDALEADLRTALDREELHVAFQPVVELATGRLVGAEALARWRHPERGVVPPCEFIAAAERSGQIERLDAQILRMTCREAQEWRRRRPEHPLWWAVNLSPRELRAGLPRELLDVLRQSALPAGALRVEITETALLEHHDAACTALEELRANGVHVMLDDFGTGMSSLSHLKRLPVDSLKLDRSFVQELRTAKDRFIVSGIIHMARMTGLEVVAEGVEHDWEIRLLRALRCPLAQGYRYAAPLEGRDLQALPAVLGPPPSPRRRRADAA